MAPNSGSGTVIKLRHLHEGGEASLALKRVHWQPHDEFGPSWVFRKHESFLFPTSKHQ